MQKMLTAALLVAFTLPFAQYSAAGVYMCEDPVTGKKSFTDRACPAADKGKKVRVEPTNFGGGVAQRKQNGTWSSDEDRSVSGRANMAEKPAVATSVSGNGLLGADS